MAARALPILATMAADVGAWAETASVLARLRVVADELGTDFNAIGLALPALGAAPARFARIRVTDWDSAAQRVAILAPMAPADDLEQADLERRVAELGRVAGLDPQLPRLALMRQRPGRHFLELETWPVPGGLTVTWHGVGAVVLAAEQARLRELGVPDAALEPFLERLRFLGPELDGLSDCQRTGGAAWWVARRGFDADERALADGYSRIDTLAGELGVGAPQRRLFERIHPVLAGGRRQLASIAVDAEGTQPWIGVEYGPQTWENTLRVLNGLLPGEITGKRLGAFAGATGADGVSALELILSAERPRVRVAVDLGGARGQGSLDAILSG